MVEIYVECVGVGEVDVVVVFVEVMCYWGDEIEFVVCFFYVDIVGWVVCVEGDVG